MRDILSGGVFLNFPAVAVSNSVRANAVRPHRRVGSRRVTARRLRRTPHVVAIQPGQLVSPHIKFGFPSLLMH